MSNMESLPQLEAPAETGQQRFLSVVREVAPEVGAAVLSNAYTDPRDLPDVAVEQDDSIKRAPVERYLFAD
jgi:hypothetical protein